MMLNRLTPSPIPVRGSTYTPSSSGPRCSISPFIRRMPLPSPARVVPQMPHIRSDLHRDGRAPDSIQPLVQVNVGANHAFPCIRGDELSAPLPHSAPQT